MFRRFTIDIPASVFEVLAALAEQERRPVRDQAAVILERGLRRAGTLAPLRTDHAAKPELEPA